MHVRTTWIISLLSFKRLVYVTIIVTITKYSILIGSVRTYLSQIGARSRGYLITGIQFEQPKLDTCNWTPTPFASQSCTLSWVLSCCFSTASYNRLNILRLIFHTKEVHENFSHFVIGAINSSKRISCRTIQYNNRARKKKNTRPITP